MVNVQLKVSDIDYIVCISDGGKCKRMGHVNMLKL